MGGEIAAETMTRKKKKGRPSLIELQKRSLKQQQEQEQHQHQQSLQQKNPNLINPISSINSNTRSTRRNPNIDGGSPPPDWIAGGDDDDERQQKKHKLLLGLNSYRNHQHYPTPLAPNLAIFGSDSNANGEDSDASLKRLKLTTLSSGSDQMVNNYPFIYIFGRRNIFPWVFRSNIFWHWNRKYFLTLDIYFIFFKKIKFWFRRVNWFFSDWIRNEWSSFDQVILFSVIGYFYINFLIFGKLEVVLNTVFLSLCPNLRIFRYYFIFIVLYLIWTDLFLCTK